MSEIDRILRNYNRYSGDGLPGEPVDAPLPVGDPSSGVHSIKREALREFGKEVVDRSAEHSATAQAAAATVAGAVDASMEAANLAAEKSEIAVAAAAASGLAKFFDTKADADAALASLSEDQLVEVLADETQSGLRARYRVEAGVFVFKLAIGTMRASQNLADLADKDAALGILGLTVKGKALVKAATAAAMRTVLELKAGALAALADQPKAEAGTDNTTLMTPLRTKQAITRNLASSALGRLYAVVTDTKAQGTSGQAHTANTWTDHDINTVDYDPDSVVTLSAPSFQFDRDGYVKISTTQRDNQAIRLIEVTGSVVVTAGSSLSSSAASAGHAPAVGIYEVAADTDYRLQFIHNTSNLAPAVNFAGRAEVFLLVEFYA
jgi:hypothetical protein